MEGTDVEQIVSTTTRRKPRKQGNEQAEGMGGEDEEDFFEDELELVEYATDRV